MAVTKVHGTGSDLDEEELIRGVWMQMDNELDEEVLTIAEIDRLEVRSGVVVLDGCHTNEGQKTQEGVLGLGRALLLAGAPMAILTLWTVNDKATFTLVTSESHLLLHLLPLLRLTFLYSQPLTFNPKIDSTFV